MFNLDFQYIFQIIPSVLKASKVTLSLAFFSLIIAFTLALIMAIIRYYDVKILSNIVKVYVSFFRGTPIITQLFLIYFGVFTLTEALKTVSAYNVVIVSLSLNAAAYMSETIRASFKSVDRGQIEASLSIGMSSIQTMRRIICPQAMTVALPSLFNSFIDLIKGTSIAFVIGVEEIMAIAGYEGSKAFKYFEIYTTIAIIYWGLSIVLEYCQRCLENKLSKNL